MDISNIDITSKLKTQVRDLMSLYEQCATNNEALISKNEQLVLELEQSRTRLIELEEENKKLLLTKGIVEGGGNGEAKHMVNNIVREIDKCIALLNK